MEIQLLEKRDIKKNVLNILKYHDLQVRDLVISKDGKYLISCSESWENEKPKVFLWNISKLLEGDNEPEVILDEHMQPKNRKCILPNENKSMAEQFS